MDQSARRPEPPLPDDPADDLIQRGLPAGVEAAIRRALEAYLPGYSLYRLTPAAVKRWKIRYSLMAGDAYYDGQSASEAYARALLACATE